MDPAQLFQFALSGLFNTGNAQAANATVTGNTTTPSTGMDAMSSLNLPGILSLLLSFSALRDWIKLFVIGGAIESARRCLMMVWAWIIESFWLTACFDETDMSYSKFEFVSDTRSLY